MIRALAYVVLCVAGCNATNQAADLSQSAVVERSSETDSLVKLMRTSLKDPDPHDTGQAMMCEIDRLFNVLGEAEAIRRIEEAERTIYTSQNLPAIVRRDSLLHGHTFGVEDCQNDTAVAVHNE